MYRLVLLFKRKFTFDVSLEQLTSREKMVTVAMNFAFLKNSGAKRSKLSTARESADTCLQDASYGAITGFIPMRRYSLCFHYRADFCQFLSPLQNPLVCFRRSVVHLRAIDDKRVVPVHLVRVRTYLREESEKFVRVYENSLFS